MLDGQYNTDDMEDTMPSVDSAVAERIATLSKEVAKDPKQAKDMRSLAEELLASARLDDGTRVLDAREANAVAIDNNNNQL